MRSLDDLYEAMNPINDDIILYYHLSIYEPIVFKKAIKDEKQRIVMDEKIASIEKNNIQKLVPKPKRKNLIGVKQIYKEKKIFKGEMEKYKARLVAKDYSQK